MSYDIYLAKTKGGTELVTVDRHQDGGTQVLGGTDEAHLNVTWNYSDWFFRCIDKELGIRWLYGKTGKECIDKLADAVRTLGTVRDKDYWAATPGNAGYALSILLRWAVMHPDAVFAGD